MINPPWDQRIARVIIRPLSGTPITPNQLTTATLIVALAGAGLFAAGDPVLANWGAGLFVLSRFLDHFDGELARLQGTPSRFGYYYDYAVGTLSYGALFTCMAIGLWSGPLGNWTAVLGAVGVVSALASMYLNINIDRVRQDEMETDSHGYPALGGFELEDGVYLLAPITWLGFLTPFFVAASIGAGLYCLWSLWSLLRLRRGGRV